MTYPRQRDLESVFEADRDLFPATDTTVLEQLEADFGALWAVPAFTSPEQRLYRRDHRDRLRRLGDQCG